MNSEQGRPTGRVVLVTGGGTGIGRAAALLFAAEGAHVALAGRREAGLGAAASQIEATGGKALAAPTDVGDEHAVDALIAQVVGGAGRAGRCAQQCRRAGRVEADHRHDRRRVRHGGPHQPSRRLAARPRRAARDASGGQGWHHPEHVILRGAGSGAGYQRICRKAGVDTLTRALALGAGPAGVGVNAIAPGVIRTPMSAGLDDTTAAALAGNAAPKRPGESDDVAEAAVWLATDAARYITGQTILVDGGSTIPGLR